MTLTGIASECEKKCPCGIGKNKASRPKKQVTLLFVLMMAFIQVGLDTGQFNTVGRV